MIGFDISSILSYLIPGGIGAVAGFLSKSGRVKSKADAYKAMAEAYEYRIESIHKVVDTLNKTEQEQAQRIAELNNALNDKTDLIRKYVEDIIKAENEVNRVNSALIEAQKEIAELKVEMEKKRCDDLPCPFRRPPNAHTPADTGGRTREEYAKSRDINLNKQQDI